MARRYRAGWQSPSPGDLPFATPEAPAAQRAGFQELVEAISPNAAGDDVGVLTETFWAALHGPAALTRGGRIPSAKRDQRLAVLLSPAARERPRVLVWARSPSGMKTSLGEVFTFSRDLGKCGVLNPYLTR
jgi:hypothetical protein